MNIRKCRIECGISLLGMAHTLHVSVLRYVFIEHSPFYLNDVLYEQIHSILK